MARGRRQRRWPGRRSWGRRAWAASVGRVRCSVLAGVIGCEAFPVLDCAGLEHVMDTDAVPDKPYGSC